MEYSEVCRTGVKICGISREADIQYVNKHLPEYIGFVFAKSKRQISFEHAKSLTNALDKRIKTVGVFVNEEMEKVVEAVTLCELDIVQIHGDEVPEYIDELKKSLESNNLTFKKRKTDIWKAIRVSSMEAIKGMSLYRADAFVLDAYVEGSYGGAGKVFDWDIAAEAGKYGKIILAGGLDSQNVNAAVQKARPFAVDISSGVEADGFKDEEKIKDFIYSVRYNTY